MHGWWRKNKKDKDTSEGQMDTRQQRYTNRSLSRVVMTTHELNKKVQETGQPHLPMRGMSTK